MTQNSPFRDFIGRHKALALALARDFPEADEETLADTIEGASDLPVLLTAVLRSRLEDLSLAEALRRRLDMMRGRLERLEGRAEQKRVLVSTALQEAGIRKLVAAEFTAYLRPSPTKLIVTDETLVPAEFWVAQQPRLDRQQLLSAVRSGREVPGAVLANSELTLEVPVMSFSTEQYRALTAKLDGQAIRERMQAGQTLSYIDWYAIAEANRVFGFDGWDRETVSLRCVWEGPRQGRPICRLYRPGADPRARQRDRDLPGRPWQRHGNRINVWRSA
jgi:hypothetical protein